MGVGDNFELYDLIKFLNTNGYSKTDLVYQPGYYASRGDVLDIYPKHFKKPFRLSFDFDTIELISTFDPLSQLTEKSHAFIRLREYFDGPETIDNIDIMSFFNNFERFYCEKREMSFHFFNQKDIKPSVFIDIAPKEVNKTTSFTDNKNVSFYLAGGEVSDLNFLIKI